MKHDIDEMLREVTERSEEIIKKREQTKIRIMSCMTIMLTMALVTVISVITGDSGAHSSQSVYGSSLIAEEAGGYVIVAVISFVIGVLVTYITQKYRRNK